MAKKKQFPIGKAQQTPAFPFAEEAKSLLENVQTAIEHGKADIAIHLLAELQERDPANPRGLLFNGKLLEKHGRPKQALEHLLAASYQLPNTPEVYWLLAKVHAKQGHQRAAISALQRYIELRPQDANSLFRLAAMYHHAGYAAHGDYWLKRAIQKQPFHVQPARKEAKLTLLALRSSEATIWKFNPASFSYALAEGHNNLTSCLDADHISIVYLFVDSAQAAPEVIRKLPAFDLVYNGITDAERGAEALKLAQKITQRINKPAINEPSRVLAASREGNYARFKDMAGVLVPKSVLVEDTQDSAKTIVQDVIQAHGMQLPVIIRLAGFQGGKYMHKVEDLATHDFSELDEELEKQPQTAYVIQYHDVSYTDERAPDTRLYPKYRAFMVDGKLYPCHVFTAGDYNVHKKNADPVMAKHSWLFDIEREFCADPAGHLGVQVWETLEAAMQLSGLDYNGVDFALSTDPGHKGKLVIFELNPAMRNWISELPSDDHVQHAWHAITEAAHLSFCKKADILPWSFNLPKGKPPKLKADDILTLRLHIKGKVQGVGYRRWFSEQLETRAIPGWVRNLPDGSVEAVIHGKLADLQPLCDEVPTGPEGAKVTDLDVTPWEGDIPEEVQVIESEMVH